MTSSFRLPDALFEKGYRLMLPKRELIDELVANPNRRDVAEVLTVQGMSFERALQVSLDASPEAYFVLGPRRQVLAAIGVSEFSVLDDAGTPWMLGSKETPKHAKALLRASRAWFELQKRRYPLLYNFVDAEYPEAIRWLKWLGFDILPAEPSGNKGALVHRVQWVREG